MKYTEIKREILHRSIILICSSCQKSMLRSRMSKYQKLSELCLYNHWDKEIRWIQSLETKSPRQLFIIICTLDLKVMWPIQRLRKEFQFLRTLFAIIVILKSSILYLAQFWKIKLKSKFSNCQINSKFKENYQRFQKFNTLRYTAERWAWSKRLNKSNQDSWEI